MGAEPQHPNKLRWHRVSQGPRPWTQDRLVYELERIARELGAVVASRASLKVQVSRWENGRVAVGPEYRSLFRHIYHVTDEELGFTSADNDAKRAASLTPISFHGSWVEAFDQAAKEWDDDVQRRSFLEGVTYVVAATSPALQWLLGTSESLAQSGDAVAVGTAHVESIREVTVAFRRLDNRYGGGHVRTSVVRFLADEVAPLVKTGRYNAATGSALLSATAEMLQLAGWASYDAGLHGIGQRYMTQALRLALACDDNSLGAEILAGLSHQASYLHDASTAVDLARAAQKTAREHGLDALLAEAAVMEAHGHASAGDQRSCTRALAMAETALDKADRSADPQWIGYFDEAYLSAKFGHCFKELGQPGKAQQFALRSLDMDNSYVRGRAFNLALLATAHAQTGEVEDACSVGSKAVELVRKMQSTRANDYIRSLRHELEPFATSPAVRSFDEIAGTLLSEAV